MNYITENDRIYATDDSGKVIAEVTFPTENGVATIDHTFVDGSLRGQGIAGQLVKMAVDKILADGNKIAATCSYAVAWLERHSEYEIVNSDTPIACKIDGRHE
ncbi:GNAT family N-acetyltransferase [Phocaeicola oris]|uniref:GNAT family N-acetyltransferase n=1 Tax=Phocaeicola oris TaxID=2896850 RepID=UPI00234EFD44|nr:GNAT family N-acetyltransferase [Phocaeicola oris]